MTLSSLLSGAASAFRQQSGMLRLPRRKLLQLCHAAALLLLAAAAVSVVWRVSRAAAPRTGSRPNGDQVDDRRSNLSDPVAVVEKLPTVRDDSDSGGFRWDFDVTAKHDWHDWEAIERDQARTGPGEGGKAYVVPKDYWTDSHKESSLSRQHAYNAFASEQIAVDRSVNDIRHPKCRDQTYSVHLPTVSVIIPFINEHPHTLKRTIHSVVNRSPKQLLEEIILVDDFSTDNDLKKPLEDYLASTPKLSTLVRVVRLPSRGGLIVARQTGAKAATGQVLIFLDSHTEANYNWLPPLLEPIAADYRTAVCPFIDVIDMDNFEYRAQDEGKRGAFDWEMYYKRLDLLPEDLKYPTRPFKSPVMAGGLFAISSQFFWELGGYDEGLKIWGGEQYELSFKIWQCGGQMFDAPCSRVGHIYRKFAPFGSGGVGNYLGKNLKRVAEVWMDEYKEHLYKRRPSYRTLDAGDLSAQKSLRERLKCKSFKWFMEEVAFDLPKNYPPVEPEDYASGYIISVQDPGMCVNSPNGHKKYYLSKCSELRSQYFVMDWHKDIRGKEGRNNCWDVSQGGDHAPVTPFQCHGGKGNQLWRYDMDMQWLIHGTNPEGRCLDTDGKTEVFVSQCDRHRESQKWKISKVDEGRVRGWSLDQL